MKQKALKYISKYLKNEIPHENVIFTIHEIKLSGAINIVNFVEKNRIF